MEERRKKEKAEEERKTRIGKVGDKKSWGWRNEDKNGREERKVRREVG